MTINDPRFPSHGAGPAGPAHRTRWRLTIDNAFLITHPWHLLPLALGTHVRGLEAIKGLSLGIGRLPEWAFREGLYDGIEFSLTTSQLFGRNVGRRWRIQRGLLERYRASGWPIMAFHACPEHTPSYFAHVRLDLTSDDPRVREGAAAQVEVAAALAAAGGAPPGPDSGPVIVFHAGRVRRDATRRERRRAIRCVGVNLRDAVRLAETARVTVTIENLPRAFGRAEHLGSARIEDLSEMIEEIGSDSAAITFDYGHANTFCGEDPEYIDRFLDRLGPRVEYAHLHYNGSHRPGFAQTVNPKRFEGYDQHLPLTRIPPSELGRFKTHLRRIVTETPVARRKLIGVELPPRSVFTVRPVLPTGATAEEQIESARRLRAWLAEM